MFWKTDLRPKALLHPHQGPFCSCSLRIMPQVLPSQHYRPMGWNDCTRVWCPPWYAKSLWGNAAIAENGQTWGTAQSLCAQSTMFSRWLHQTYMTYGPSSFQIVYFIPFSLKTHKSVKDHNVFSKYSFIYSIYIPHIASVSEGICFYRWEDICRVIFKRNLSPQVCTPDICGISQDNQCENMVVLSVCK